MHKLITYLLSVKGLRQNLVAVSFKLKIQKLSFLLATVSFLVHLTMSVTSNI